LRKNAGFVVAVAIVLLAVMGGTAASVYAARGQGQGEPLATGEVGTEAAEEASVPGFDDAERLADYVENSTYDMLCEWYFAGDVRLDEASRRYVSRFVSDGVRECGLFTGAADIDSDMLDGKIRELALMALQRTTGEIKYVSDSGVLPEDFEGPSGDELEMLAGQLGSSLGGSITSMVSAYAGCISDIDYTISELGEWYDNISGEIDAVKNDIAELKASSGEGSSDGAAQIRVLEERQSGLEAELVTVEGLLEALEEQKARITVMGVQLDSTRLELVASVDEVRAGLEQLIGDLASQAGESDDKIMEYVDELKGVCDDLENGKVEAGDFGVYKSSIADTLEKLKAELSSLMKAGDEALARELSDSTEAVTVSFTADLEKVGLSLGNLEARLEGVADDANGSFGLLTGRITANEDSIAGINDAMDELKKSVSDGKSSLASAITVEGVATSSDASYAVLADNVGRLSAARYNAGYGVGVLDTKKGTATAGMVLKGSTFTSVLGVEMEGDMPDNGSLDWKPSGQETYNVPFGYYSGGTLDSSEAYNSGVSEGYDSGYGKGKSDGYATGYSKGTSDGYDSGYSQGYNDGYKDADKEMVYYSGWLYPAYKYKEYDDDECNAFVLKLPTCSWSMARTSMSDGYAGGNWIHGGPTEYTFKGPEWHASSSYFSRIWVEAWYLPE
jgi:hypothetical protein